MSKYKENERKKAIDLIKNSELFEGRKAGGEYRKIKRDFVLSDENYNLYHSIREDVKTYFKENRISWWDNGQKRPTAHVLSSQIACVNHLFPVRNDRDEVLKIAQIICKDIIGVFVIETDKFPPAYIAFEAVSNKDYLNECEKGKKPTRGTLCTSIDALIYAKHKNGKSYFLAIEWKYTENFENKDKSVEDRKGEPKGTNGKGKERLDRYVNNAPNLIPNSKQLKIKLSDYKSSIYFIDPFYQLMRQTLWAEQMIAHRNSEKISAEDFIHVHVIPLGNSDLLGKTHPRSNKTMEATWQENLQDPNKYKIISPGDLLADIDTNKFGELKKYLEKRYW